MLQVLGHNVVSSSPFDGYCQLISLNRQPVLVTLNVVSPFFRMSGFVSSSMDLIAKRTHIGLPQFTLPHYMPFYPEFAAG